MIRTKIMGIVNVTPDSFYPASRTQTLDAAIKRALTLIQEGADIIDIGGESTRPGAEIVSIQEELERVIPVIQTIKSMTNTAISIDTMKPEVAIQAVQYGASLINDVTGFIDPRMREIAKEAHASCIVMHMQGTPKTMQQNPVYENGVVFDVCQWLSLQADRLIQEGIEPEKIILDPGIGFGKTMEDNFELIKHLSSFQELGYKMLYGISRKSFLRKFLNKPVEDLLLATLALNTKLMLSGVDIIRVHDVQEHQEVRKLLTVFA